MFCKCKETTSSTCSCSNPLCPLSGQTHCDPRDSVCLTFSPVRSRFPDCSQFPATICRCCVPAPDRQTLADSRLVVDYKVVICKAPPPLSVKNIGSDFWICQPTAPLYDCSARVRRQQSAASLFQQWSCRRQILL